MAVRYDSSSRWTSTARRGALYATSFANVRAAQKLPRRCRKSRGKRVEEQRHPVYRRALADLREQYLALDSHPFRVGHVHHVGDYVSCAVAPADYADPERSEGAGGLWERAAAEVLRGADAVEA